MLWSRQTSEAVDDVPVGCTQRATRRTRTKAMKQASKHFQAGDVEAFYETLTVASFRKSRISVTLANPSLYDCPLVGVSQRFEEMTGYTRSDILGRNCRFLNYGCPMPAKVRHELRYTTRTHTRFVGILTNRRKNGEFFKNLLHMSSLRVGKSMYILGIQADVTNSDANLEEEKHMEELNQIVDAIFASNVNAWAALQAMNFGHVNLDANLESMIPWYTEMQLVPKYQPNVYREARETFVSLAHNDSMSGTRLCYSNTFLEVRSEESPGERLMRLRMVHSEPDLGVLDTGPLRSLTPQALRDSSAYLQPGSSPLPPRDPPKHQVSYAAEVPAPPEADDVPVCLKSRGSEAHPHGCTPCSFHCYSQIGCDRGDSCAFCHMDHPKRTRRRGKRKPKGRVDSSSANLSGVAEECKLFEDSMLPCLPATVQPSPTPMNLMPLLGALELLSPLPGVRISSEPFASSSSAGPTVEPSTTDGGEMTDRDLMEDWLVPDPWSSQEGRTLTYSESSILLAIGQWKQVLPFVRGEFQGDTQFTVDHPLPRGLLLNRSTGVISGWACKLTAPGGGFHTITMHGEIGSVDTTIHISVIDAANASCTSSCNEALAGELKMFEGMVSGISGAGTSEEE